MADAGTAPEVVHHGGQGSRDEKMARRFVVHSGWSHGGIQSFSGHPSFPGSAGKSPREGATRHRKVEAGAPRALRVGKAVPRKAIDRPIGMASG